MISGGGSAEQTYANGQVKISPSLISGQDFCWVATYGQSQATAVAQRQRSASIDRTHGAGQFRIFFQERFDRHARGRE